MKCPHCGIAIHEAFTSKPFIGEPAISIEGKIAVAQRHWTYQHQRCPECAEAILFLIYGVSDGSTITRFLAFPPNAARPLPREVSNPYRQDFVEACKVLADSPKASAALSRRCLQAILRDKATVKAKDLYDQIEEVIASKAVPAYIAEDLHAVRVIGNFAAHPMKSTNSREILEVEPGEAEWNLDVLERLFDFYFVGPVRSQKRKDELNKKLIAAGKQPLP